MNFFTKNIVFLFFIFSFFSNLVYTQNKPLGKEERMERKKRSKDSSRSKSDEKKQKKPESAIEYGDPVRIYFYFNNDKYRNEYKWVDKTEAIISQLAYDIIYTQNDIFLNSQLFARILVYGDRELSDNQDNVNEIGDGLIKAASNKLKEAINSNKWILYGLEVRKNGSKNCIPDIYYIQRNNTQRSICAKYKDVHCTKKNIQSDTDKNEIIDFTNVIHFLYLNDNIYRLMQFIFEKIYNHDNRLIISLNGHGSDLNGGKKSDDFGLATSKAISILRLLNKIAEKKLVIVKINSCYSKKTIDFFFVDSFLNGNDSNDNNNKKIDMNDNFFIMLTGGITNSTSTFIGLETLCEYKNIFNNIEDNDLWPKFFVGNKEYISGLDNNYFENYLFNFLRKNKSDTIKALSDKLAGEIKDFYNIESIKISSDKIMDKLNTWNSSNDFQDLKVQAFTKYYIQESLNNSNDVTSKNNILILHENKFLVLNNEPLTDFVKTDVKGVIDVVNVDYSGYDKSISRLGFDKAKNTDIKIKLLNITVSNNECNLGIFDEKSNSWVTQKFNECINSKIEQLKRQNSEISKKEMEKEVSKFLLKNILISQPLNFALIFKECGIYNILRIGITYTIDNESVRYSMLFYCKVVVYNNDKSLLTSIFKYKDQQFQLRQVVFERSNPPKCNTFDLGDLLTIFNELKIDQPGLNFHKFVTTFLFYEIGLIVGVNTITQADEKLILNFVKNVDEIIKFSHGSGVDGLNMDDIGLKAINIKNIKLVLNENTTPAEFLQQFLNDYKSIKIISLDNCGLDDSAFDADRSVLKLTQNLKELSLPNNNLTNFKIDSDFIRYDEKIAKFGIGIFNLSNNNLNGIPFVLKTDMENKIVDVYPIKISLTNTAGLYNEINVMNNNISNESVEGLKKDAELLFNDAQNSKNKKRKKILFKYGNDNDCKEAFL